MLSLPASGAAAPRAVAKGITRPPSAPPARLPPESGPAPAAPGAPGRQTLPATDRLPPAQRRLGASPPAPGPRRPQRRPARGGCGEARAAPRRAGLLSDAARGRTATDASPAGGTRLEERRGGASHPEGSGRRVPGAASGSRLRRGSPESPGGRRSDTATGPWGRGGVFLGTNPLEMRLRASLRERFPPVNRRGVHKTENPPSVSPGCSQPATHRSLLTSLEIKSVCVCVSMNTYTLVESNLG